MYVCFKYDLKFTLFGSHILWQYFDKKIDLILNNLNIESNDRDIEKELFMSNKYKFNFY